VELLVKERLTGAIILVVLIVLLVPELLSGPKHPGAAAPAAASNSSEEPPLRSYTINLGDDSHPRSAAATSTGATIPQPSGPEQPTTPQANQPEQSAGEQPAAPTQNSSADTLQGSAAQGTGSAAQAPAPQSSASQSSSVPNAPEPKQTAPTPQSPAAQSQKAAKPHSSTATPAAVANSSSGSEGGWFVQLGVFASRENAERLAVEVRNKGFKTSVSPVTSAKRKLYRVRVGPAPDRAAAQELQGRLKAAGRPGGTLVPYS
jgi:DedD protein